MSTARFFKKQPQFIPLSEVTVIKKSEQFDTTTILDDYRPISPTTELMYKIPDNRTTAEQELEKEFYPIGKRSAEAWEESFFSYAHAAEAVANKSFHVVKKVMRKMQLAFLKFNAPNSPMSELETTNCQFYRLFAPDLVPKMHTVYNKKFDIIGVASKMLDGFQCIREVPLAPTDLVIESLSNNTITIHELKQIYKLYQTQKEYKLSDKNDDELLNFQLPKKTISISAKDLKHFEIIRAAAIVLVLSYFFEEDDLHAGNLAKKGRIDFDMSLWSILHQYKNAGFLDRKVREPVSGQFDITNRDIRNFPKLMDAAPYYWPTGSGRWIADVANSVYAFTSNNYAKDVSSTYALLAEHPVFVELKYDIFTELCLMPSSAYRSIAEVEISDCTLIPKENQTVISVIEQHLRDRTERCKNVLSNMPEYRRYFQAQGETVLADFKERMTARNQQLEERLAKRTAIDPTFPKTYPEFIKQKINLKQIDESFMHLNVKCQDAMREEARCKARFLQCKQSNM